MSAPFSMTAYGASKVEIAGYLVCCEIKSVNSRYLDLVLKIPRDFASVEPALKKIVSEHCQRGRVEVAITVNAIRLEQQVVGDLGRFHGYLKAAESLLTSVGVAWTDGLKEQVARDILIRKDVIVEGTSSIPFESLNLEEVVRAAVKNLRVSQSLEGKTLAADLIQRRDSIEQILAKVQSLHVGLRAKYQETLEANLARLIKDGSLPPERIIGEVALLSERSDITEEVVRLKSHLNLFSTVVNESPAGRKLDFLTQECLREINTIGSKIQDAAAQHLVVEMKAQVERIKEQVQNIE